MTNKLSPPFISICFTEKLSSNENKTTKEKVPTIETHKIDNNKVSSVEVCALIFLYCFSSFLLILAESRQMS
jgi:hypothetical protein